MDQLAQIEHWLYQYAAAFKLGWGKPNVGTCMKVFAALNGRPLEDLHDKLVQMHSANAKPYRDYYWFVTILKDEFMEAPHVGTA